MITLALSPRWPRVDASRRRRGRLLLWAMAGDGRGGRHRAGGGDRAGSLPVAAQVAGPAAGYGYAQTVDPNTQADSGVLLVVAQLVGGHAVLRPGHGPAGASRCLAYSLESIPPGAYVFNAARGGGHASGWREACWPLAVRLALPVVALLVMVDVALALLGRLNAQLQLLSLAFPIKMLRRWCCWRLDRGAVPARCWRPSAAWCSERCARCCGLMNADGRDNGKNRTAHRQRAAKRRARKASFPPRASSSRPCSSWLSWRLLDAWGGAWLAEFRATDARTLWRPAFAAELGAADSVDPAATCLITGQAAGACRSACWLVVTLALQLVATRFGVSLKKLTPDLHAPEPAAPSCAICPGRTCRRWCAPPSCCRCFSGRSTSSCATTCSPIWLCPCQGVESGFSASVRIADGAALEGGRRLPGVRRRGPVPADAPLPQGPAHEQAGDHATRSRKSKAIRR